MKGKCLSSLLCLWLGALFSGCTNTPDAETGSKPLETKAKAPTEEIHAMSNKEDSEGSGNEGVGNFSDEGTDRYSELALLFITEELYTVEELDEMEEEKRRYAFDTFDLNRDGRKEVFVAMLNGWCGTGGCRFWVIDDEGGLVSTTSVIRFPIGISMRTTNRWHDLFAFSNGKQRVLTYDGKAYSQNGSLADTISKQMRKELTLEEVLLDPKEYYIEF